MLHFEIELGYPIAKPIWPAAWAAIRANAWGSNGAGFSWKDMTVVKLGYQWETSPAHTWRVGYSKTNQPIRESDLNILVPAVMG